MSLVTYRLFCVFQVETGVAKMNTVTVATAAEPYMATTVTNNSSAVSGYGVHSVTVVTGNYSAGVPTLVTNGLIGGGRTNPAGPQLEEEEDKMEELMMRGEDTRLNLLNFSPDEHEPLLRREQPPAESEHLPHHQLRAGNVLSGRGSNSNNNNNRAALGSEVKIHGLEIHGNIMGSEVSRGRGISSPRPEQQRCRDSNFVSTKAQDELVPEACGTLASQEQESSSLESAGLPLTLAQKPSATYTPDSVAPASDREAPVGNPEFSPLEVLAPKILVMSDSETTPLAEAPSPESAALQVSADLSSSFVGQDKVRRPERPRSLDLSSSSISTGKSRLKV